MTSRRERKRRVEELLRLGTHQEVLEALWAVPPMEAVNSLISFLPSVEPCVRWGAVTGLGAVVARLADEDMEQGRVILRRLMWQLNDESGGIGWGCPEAMGEILACHDRLASEFAHVLVSYVREDGNFLEYPPLQRGALWGVGRFAQVRPNLAQDAGPHLEPFLGSYDPLLRGLALWCLGSLGYKAAATHVRPLLADAAQFEIYLNRKNIRLRVMDMAEIAMGRLS